MSGDPRREGDMFDDIGDSWEETFFRGAWRVLYPFTSHYFSTSAGFRMHYLDEGEGEPVLMLHGNPTWSFYYRRLILALRREYRCVAPDHIGCGLSDKPQQYSYRLKRHVENLRELVEALDLQDITLVLHDWGGAIGMAMAQQCAGRIKRIIVLNTAAFPSKRIPFRISICRLPVFGALAIRLFNAFPRAAVRMAVVRRERMIPHAEEGYLLPYDSWRNRVAVLRFVQDIPMKPDHPSYGLLEKTGGNLGMFRELPMLICWGQRDFCFDDSFFKKWEELFPNAEAHRFPNAGHYVLEDAHEEIIPLVKKFLAER